MSKGKTITTAETILILEAAKRGLTAEQIGELVGRHPSTIWGIFRDNGVHSRIRYRQSDVIDMQIAKYTAMLPAETPAPVNVVVTLDAEPNIPPASLSVEPSGLTSGLTAGLNALRRLLDLIDRGALDTLLDLAAALDELQKGR